MFISLKRSSSKVCMQRGFALIDIILAMVVFSLLIGSIMLVTKASSTLCIQTSTTWTRHQQIQGLIDFFRNIFRYFPNSGNIESWTDSQTYLRLRGVSSIIPTIVIPTSTTNTPPDNVSFVTKLRDDGNFDLYIVQQPTDELAISTPDPANGFLLFQNIVTISWHFYNKQTQLWEDDWNTANPKPRLVELDLQLVDQDTPIKYTFWLPNAN